MSPVDERGAREVMLAFLRVLEPVLDDVPAAQALPRASAAARLLGLDGLDRLLAACAPRAAGAWPVELMPALDRVRRLIARAREAGTLEPFRAADHELGGLAAQVEAIEWSSVVAPEGRAETRPTPAIVTLSVAAALEGVPLAAAARALAERARIEPPVAAALRAALDWLLGPTRVPLSLRVDDSVLELRCERVDPLGVEPAAEVLADAGANLGPVNGGTWLVRVPLYDEAPSHLMIVRGGLDLAIPWHAVLRLHMASPAEMAERRLAGCPVLESAGGAPGAQVPLALLAHGRRRAWLPAERLVWRLKARPVATDEAPPLDELGPQVETEEGERYWVVDPAVLLRHVPVTAAARAGVPPAASDARAPLATAAPPAAAAPPAVADAPPAAAATPAEARPAAVAGAAGEPDRAAVPVVPPAAASAPAPATPAATRGLFVLRSEDVVRLERQTPATPEPPVRPPQTLTRAAVEPMPAEPVPVPSPPAGPPLPPAATPVAPPPLRASGRTALVAEDSIVARIFLARSLAQRGFDVRAVETAAALRAELEQRAWSLVCVDVELPDAAGATFLTELSGRFGARSVLVALVRDADDRAAARAAGIDRMLRKPFDEAELDRLVSRLGSRT